MTDTNVTQLLAQMRGMALEAKGQPKLVDVAAGNDFSLLLKQSIDAVNTVQQTSGKMTTAFETGDSNISLAQVMIASQKADVSFQALMQVRNKLVSAYQDVMNMPM